MGMGEETLEEGQEEVTGFLFDTHVWIWFQRSDTQQITSGVRDQMLEWQQEGRLHISAVSAWELALLTASKYIDLGTSVDQFLDLATQDGGLRLLPLTPRILIESARLPGELHRDPADRMLVATAREYGLSLVTRDKLLLQYAKAGHLNARKP
jgi:PIN domain nuclease of toxin-antitoxin system